MGYTPCTRIPCGYCTDLCGWVLWLKGKAGAVDKNWKLQRYSRKDYAEVVDFPVEIVGRDGVVRRYSFADSIRLYQRRITFAAIRYHDEELVRAEVHHCRSRVEQLRRSYFHHFGWGRPDEGPDGVACFGEYAGEVAAFLRQQLQSTARPEITITALEGADLKAKFVTGVTTLDRKEYLESFVKDWLKTTDSSPNSTLIVADDGSTDGTLEWLREDLDLGQSRLVVIRNDGSGIARQSNSIIDFVSQMDPLPSAVFMCNDDIRFLKRGWDDAYFFAMQQSGFDHLVYFNPEWKPPSHAEGSPRFEGLFSSCSARDAMGCFYTLTPELISKIGFFDEGSFPVRGHSHVDYTLRACRVEANDSQYLYDISDSNGYIGMVMRDGYRRTHRILSVNERIVSTSETALVKREGILLTEGRKFIHRSW